MTPITNPMHPRTLERAMTPLRDRDAVCKLNAERRAKNWPGVRLPYATARKYSVQRERNPTLHQDAVKVLSRREWRAATRAERRAQKDARRRLLRAGAAR